MGGFMSLWLSARHPQLIGSALAFNPGPEFHVGDKGWRVLWRPKDHVSSHTLTMVRLVRASGDYISQYHEETREAYARAHDVSFEYRRDEYHRHWATSIEGDVRLSYAGIRKFHARMMRPSSGATTIHTERSKYGATKWPSRVPGRASRACTMSHRRACALLHGRGRRTGRQSRITASRSPPPLSTSLARAISGWITISQAADA